MGATGSTTRGDLAKAEGCRRRYLVEIDGWNGIAWEDDGTGTAPASGVWGKPGYLCLDRPQGELSSGIDLKKATCDISSITVDLRNIPDPDDEQTYYFAKMFAPGKHSLASEKTCYMARSSATEELVYATDTTIYSKQDVSAWPASGTIYTAGETISYAGKGTKTFTGCTRGLYPCVGSHAALTYRIPSASQSFNGMLISTSPYSWIGRRIALKVVTHDELNGSAQWQDTAQALLVWIGRIKTIRFNGRDNTWQLGCDSLIADLERKVCSGGMPSASLAGVNLSGSRGMTVHVEQWGEIGAGTSAVDVEHSADVTFVPGVYKDPMVLAKMVEDELNAATATWDIGTWTVWRPDLANGGPFRISIRNSGTDAKTVKLWSRPNRGSSLSADPRCHALNALGFGRDYYEALINDPGGEQPEGGTTPLADADGPPFIVYHPLNEQVNGQHLHYMYAEPPLWTNQGGTGGTLASVQIDCGEEPATSNVEEVYVAHYTATDTALDTEAAITYNRLTLDGCSRRFYGGATSGHYGPEFFVGRLEGAGPVYVEQVYAAQVLDSAGRARGPFELLLYMLLSSGTSGYNHATYDKHPFAMRVNFDADLIDTQSFLDADAAVAGTDLAKRDYYIMREPVSFAELLQRECRLFGYVLCWDAVAAKFKLKSINCHALDYQVLTLSDANTTTLEEHPDADSSEDTIVNQWVLKCNYNHNNDTWGPTITIDDEESQIGTAISSISLEHPGIWIDSGDEGIRDLLKTALLRYQDTFRYPWWKVGRSLAPDLYTAISAGDIVEFKCSFMPDPYGSGSMSVDVMALVLNVSWDPSTGDGDVTLLLYSRYPASSRVPWAASALTNVAVANGGLNNAAHELTLIGWKWGNAATDSHDGAWIVSGNELDVSERAPADSLNPTKWTVVAAANYDAATCVLTVTSNSAFSGWDPSSEYVVTPAGYGTVSAGMKSSHTWLANAETLLLPGGDRAQRWN